MVLLRKNSFFIVNTINDSEEKYNGEGKNKEK